MVTPAGLLVLSAVVHVWPLIQDAVPVERVAWPVYVLWAVAFGAPAPQPGSTQRPSAACRWRNWRRRASSSRVFGRSPASAALWRIRESTPLHR